MRKVTEQFFCDRCGTEVEALADLKLVAYETPDDIGMESLAGRQVLLMDVCHVCFGQIVEGDLSLATDRPAV